MTPRRYRMDQRQEAAEQTRANILAAARELLGAPEGIAGFTIDTVARKAGVARMTVYYQFGSKVGLLEALSDDLAARGQMDRLAGAFQEADPVEALNRYVATFAHFWATDRLAMRRLRALGALDPDFATVIRARDERRRMGIRMLVERLLAARGASSVDASAAGEALMGVIFTLLSFESFDSLAGPDRPLEDATPVVQRLVCAAAASFAGME